MAKSLEQQQAEYEQKLAYEAEKQQMQLAYNQAANQQKLQSQNSSSKNILLGLDGDGGRYNDMPLVSAFNQYLNTEKLDNPYYAGANAFRQTAAPQGGDFWDNLAFNAIKGLGSGFLGQMGEQDIMGTFQEEMVPQLKQIYPQTSFDKVGEAGLDPDVARLALINALQDTEQKQSMEKLGLQYGNPRLRDAILGGYLKPNGLATETPIRPDGPMSLDEGYEYLKNDVGLGESTTRARMAGLQRKYDDAVAKGIPGALEASSDFAAKARLLEQGMADFGETGPLYGPGKKSLLSVLDATGAGELFGLDTGKMLRGSQAFDVSAWKEAFLNKMPGAITEKELDKMLNLGGGVSATPETNQRLVDAAKKLSIIAENYGLDMENYIAKNGTMEGFDSQWAAKKKNLMQSLGESGSLGATSGTSQSSGSSLIPQVGQEFQGSKVLRVTKKK